MDSRQKIQDQIRYLQDKLSKGSTGAVGPLPESLKLRPKRHIALLVAYDGWAHSGLAWQPYSPQIPLPTVETCLLDALEQARLIEPAVRNDGFGCGFERCGRTDAGVSSSGQVVNLWVRSDVEDPMQTGEVWRAKKPPATLEIPYVQLLSRFLPPSIRVLAWSPVTASFSSRYSCVWRHYKYFFSSSVFSSLRGHSFDFGSAYSTDDFLKALDVARLSAPGLELDVDLMRQAAANLIGDHDFRNLCRIDPGKQLPMHVRSVYSASIDPVAGTPDMYCLNLRGHAFLYNQVRSIVALLMLIGARLETTKLIEDLLWTSDRTETTVRMHGSSPHDEVIDNKPGYEMAADLPLVLWQCGFNASDVDWRIDNMPRSNDANYKKWQDLETKSGAPLAARPSGHDAGPIEPERAFRQSLVAMNRTWEQNRLKSTIEQHHIGSFARVASQAIKSFGNSDRVESEVPPVMVPHGAGDFSLTRQYRPVLSRPRQDTPDELNRRWAEGRGKWRMDIREQNKEAADKQRQINLETKRLAMLKAREAGT